jgi:hypothetical protein
MKMNISTTVGAFVALVIFAIGLGFLLSWPIMWLWNNALVGAVDGVNEIGWLQAWGINILSGFLFKSYALTHKTKE